jgi:hypothetical protein
MLLDQNQLLAEKLAPHIGSLTLRPSYSAVPHPFTTVYLHYVGRLFNLWGGQLISPQDTPLRSRLEAHLVL